MLITTAGVGIKNVWVNNKKNVHKMLQHILDSTDFISSYICFIQQGGGVRGGGQTHKTKGSGRKALP